MAKTLKFGENGKWATKTGSSMAYNDQNDNFKPAPFTTERATSATRVNKQGLIEVVGNDKLRIDYKDSSNGVALLEPARTNLITNSEKFVDAPTGNTNMDVFSGTITNDNTTSPDGNTKGMKFTISSGSTSTLRIYQSDLSTSADTTFSIYVKSGTTNSLSINVAGGTATSATATSVWQRITTTDTSNSNKFIDVVVSGSVGDYIYIFGAQVEQGSYPTSYIPTSGSSATRAADVANGAGNAQVFNDSEGVLYANIAALANDDTIRELSISNGTTTKRVVFRFNAVPNQVRATVRNSGGNMFNSNKSINDATFFNKIAIKYKLNDFALWANGFELATDTSGSTFDANTLDTLNFDSGAGANDMFCKTKEIGVYDTALTDAELEALTSYTSFTNMANELNLTIR